MHGSMPEISIIVPVYNAEKTLEDTIESLVHQTETHIEILLCNDESEDASLQIAQRAAQEDARIRVLDLPKGGVSLTRNAGLKEARGQYVMFCDADDTYELNACEHMKNAIQNCDLAIAHFYLDIGKISSDRGLIDEERVLNERDFLDALVRKPGTFYFSALWNKIYKADILRKNAILFDSYFTWGEDFDFNMRYYKHVHNVRFTPVPLYHYNKGSYSTSLRTLKQLGHSVGIKDRLHDSLVSLYEEKNLYQEYKTLINLYYFNVTLND